MYRWILLQLEKNRKCELLMYLLNVCEVYNFIKMTAGTYFQIFLSFPAIYLQIVSYK